MGVRSTAPRRRPRPAQRVGEDGLGNGRLGDAGAGSDEDGSGTVAVREGGGEGVPVDEPGRRDGVGGVLLGATEDRLGLVERSGAGGRYVAESLGAGRMRK